MNCQVVTFLDEEVRPELSAYKDVLETVATVEV
jgi:hypothetical protein